MTLSGASLTLLHQGAETKADLHVLTRADGEWVVKDFASKPAWVRFIGRLQVARECRAYRNLAGVPGIPRFGGRIDAHALAIEKISGEPLARAPRRSERPVEFWNKLCSVVEGMHRRGVVHLDLRGWDNVLLDPHDEVFVVDLASAMTLPPGSLRHRLLFDWLRRTDESAMLKWKKRLDAGAYTEEEARIVRRHGRLRALWIFNPKGRPRDKDGKS